MGKYCFGVDLGGTTVKIGLFDTEGTVLDKWEIPTRKEDSGSKILPDIAQAFQTIIPRPPHAAWTASSARAGTAPARHCIPFFSGGS